MAKEEAAEENTKPKKNLGKMLMPLLLVVNVAVVGVSLFLVYTSTIGYEKPLKTEDDFKRELASYRKSLETGPVLFTMKEFNTNLSGLPKRFIRLKVSLEMMTAAGFEEANDFGPGARDRVMKLLSGKSFYNLEGVQGKLQLKNQIMAEVNELLKTGVVKDVYFSTFAIQ